VADSGHPAEHPAAKASGKNYRRHGARYRARRRAVDVLYEAEARDVDPVAIVEDRISLARVDITLVAPIAPYTSDIIAGVAEELNRIDDIIAEYLAENWELNRISAVDRAILRVAVWEMIFNPDVPVKTALSEAVELASQYSGASAPAYINAVLDSVVKNIDALRRLPVGVSEVDDADELSFADALAQAGEEPDDAGADLGEFLDSDEWDEVAESPKSPAPEPAEPDASDAPKPGDQLAQVADSDEAAEADVPDGVGETAPEPAEPGGGDEPGDQPVQIGGVEAGGEAAAAPDDSVESAEPTNPDLSGEPAETAEKPVHPTDKVDHYIDLTTFTNHTHFLSRTDPGESWWSWWRWLHRGS